ncbi:hypothetical protein MCEMIH16_00881 [Caulobacteraceae bacterium]
MTRAVPDAPATHFRLSEESWAEIAAAYRNGATARELGARWKVSPTTIYRYACRDGFTKKRDSDAIARAHAEAIANEETADLAARDVQTVPLPDIHPEALKQRALEDMARAMAAGRVAEAERLGRLALTLGKMGAPERRPGDAEFDQEGIPQQRPPIDMAAKVDTFAEWVFPHIEKVALKLLGDRYHGPGIFSRAAMRWRAETFGPECAANDYAEMLAGGWTGGVYDENGNILPGWDSRSLRHPQIPAPPGYKGFEETRGE